MKPAHIDALIDLTYGTLILVSVVLIVYVGTTVGAAFGFGVLASYAVHVVWKMARFDPDWMTREVAERVEETVSEEVERTVEDTVSREVDGVAEQVERTVGDDVAAGIEATVSQQIERTVGEEVDEVIGKLDEIEEHTQRDPGETDEDDPSREGT